MRFALLLLLWPCFPFSDVRLSWRLFGLNSFVCVLLSSFPTAVVVHHLFFGCCLVAMHSFLGCAAPLLQLSSSESVCSHLLHCLLLRGFFWLHSVVFLLLDADWWRCIPFSYVRLSWCWFAVFWLHAFLFVLFPAVGVSSCFSWMRFGGDGAFSSRMCCLSCSFAILSLLPFHEWLCPSSCAALRAF